MASYSGGPGVRRAGLPKAEPGTLAPGQRRRRRRLDGDDERWFTHMEQALG